MSPTRRPPRATARQAAVAATAPGRVAILLGDDDARVRDWLRGRQAANDIRVQSIRLPLANGLAHEVMGELADALAREAPRWILVHLTSCLALGVEVVRRLVRGTPGSDWVLCWEEPTVDALPWLLHLRARGVLSPMDSAQDLQRALRTMERGELWFPRVVTRWLLQALTDAGQSAAPAVASALLGEPLTAREEEVWSLLRQGMTNKQIAARLGISANTVKKHLSHAFEKRGLRGRRQALS